MIKEAFNQVVTGQDLSEEQSRAVMEEIMSGEATPAQIAAFITALRMKKETVAEITGGARVMRDKAVKIKVEGDVVDTCGTGGDEAGTFNISTVAAFVAAGAGVKIAKHGNRSVSSKCGSADLLMALGVKINLPPEGIEKSIQEVGFGFLFAPDLHGAMKYAIGPRREIGIRTVFNILGPLTNPAGARYQLLGVYDPDLTEIMTLVLRNLGSERVFCVYGEDGLDEVSLSSSTKVTELKRGEINTYRIRPEEFGFKRAPLSALAGGSPEENASMAIDVLKGKFGPRRDIVLLNAALALVAGKLTETVEEGINRAAMSIDSGAALAKLEALKELTNSF
ncbi:MAG: anthranilate phosphoribosyltransferase [bacterium]